MANTNQRMRKWSDNRLRRMKRGKPAIAKQVRMMAYGILLERKRR